MCKKILLCFIVALNFLSVAYASSKSMVENEIAGYKFSDYSTTIYKGNTAPIRFDKASKVFKTQISNDYITGKDNFAGHYTVSMWGCGSDCISAVMVDKKTGKIYDFPINDSYYGCPLEDNEDFYKNIIAFRSDSRLLVTCSCKDYEDENIAKRIKTYHVKLWNEKTKKFEKLKDVEKVTFY